MGYLRGRVGHQPKIAKNMLRMLTTEIIFRLWKKILRGSNFGDLLRRAGGQYKKSVWPILEIYPRYYIIVRIKFFNMLRMMLQKSVCESRVLGVLIFEIPI